jgi:hypothetical protein
MTQLTTHDTCRDGLLRPAIPEWKAHPYGTVTVARAKPLLLLV